MSAADKRRRRARAAAQRALRPIVPPVVVTSPESESEPKRLQAGGRAGAVVNGEVGQWPPGTSGNPDGYSKGRRIGDAIHRLITKADLEDKIASTVVSMALGVQGQRPADLGWFRELRDMVDGPTPRHVNVVRPADETIVNVAVPVVTNVVLPDIDPVVAERILAAAEPDVTIDENEGDETT